MTPRRPSAAETAALLAMVVAVALLFRESVWGGGVFYNRDIHLVWVPQVEAIVRSWAAGQFPLWDPLASFGQPLLADPSAEVLYPPTLLNLIMLPWTYYTWFAFGHVLFSALCAYGLGRHWRLRPVAAFVMALGWAFSGPFISLVDLWHHLAGAAWLPAVVWTIDRLGERPTLPRSLMAGVAAGLQVLAGSFDMCVLTGFFAAVVLAARHVRWSTFVSRAHARLVGLTSLAGLVALALSAGLWVSAVEVVSHGSRTAFTERVRTFWSVHPIGLAETLVSGVFEDVPLRNDLKLRLSEGREPFLHSLYLGGGLAGLVIIGALASRSSLRIAMIAIGAATAALCLGRHAPFYSWAVTLLPPLTLFRYPVKAMVGVAFAWAVLAGLGVEAWSNPDDRRSGLGPRICRACYSLLPLAIGALTVWAFAWPGSLAILLIDSTGPLAASDSLGALRVELLRETIVALLVSGLTWISWRRPRMMLVGVAAVVAVADLAIHHWHPSPVAPRQFYAVRPVGTTEIGDRDSARLYVYDYSVDNSLLRGDGGRGLIMKRYIDGWDPFASRSISYDMRWAPATASRWGYRTGFEVDTRGLHPRPLWVLTRVVREVEDNAQRLRLLQLGGITHVVALHDSSFDNLIPTATLEALSLADVRIFRVPDTLTPAFLVGRSFRAPGPRTLEVLLHSAFDPRETVLLEEGPTVTREDRLNGRVLALHRTPSRVSVDVDVDRPAFLVLLDAWSPGWKAQVDGGATRSYVANLAFRSVAVPAGRHRVVWAYRPTATLVGLGVSLASALGLAIAGLWYSRARTAR